MNIYLHTNENYNSKLTFCLLGNNIFEGKNLNKMNNHIFMILEKEFYFNTNRSNNGKI